MTLANFAKSAGAGTAIISIALTGILIRSPHGRAQDGGDDSLRIKQGFQIAPVKLNLAGKSPDQVDLVGLGSYWVNAVSDCNFCHTSGGPPDFNFLARHNPYFLF